MRPPRLNFEHTEAAEDLTARTRPTRDNYIVFGPNGESRGGKPMPERVLHNTLDCRAGHPSVKEIWNTFHEAEVRIATPEDIRTHRQCRGVDCRRARGEA